MRPSSISSTLASATRFDRNRLEVLDWHEHQNLSFCFVVRGDYRETSSRGNFTCKSGDIVIKPAGLRHQNTFGQVGAVCLLLEISNEFFEGSGELFEPEINGPIRDPGFTRIGLELRQEFGAADGLSPLMLQGIALRSIVTGLRFARKRPRKAQVENIRALLDEGVGASLLRSAI